MRNGKYLLSLLLVLCLLLCLLPATALAAPGNAPARETTAEEAAEDEALPAEEDAIAEDAVEDELPAEEDAILEEVFEDETPAEEDVIAEELFEAELPAEETAEPLPEDPDPAQTPEGQCFTVEREESFFAMASDTVYNNGGTVYNNGGLVYNNGGLVYNNGGIVYNNGGEIYSNGGTVYNNVGTVYSNGAQVHNFMGTEEDSVIHSYFRVTTAEDYSAAANFSGAELDTDGSLLIRQDEELVITPLSGCRIVAVEASCGNVAENEDGSFTVSQVDAPLTLALSIEPEAPELSLSSGTYGEPQPLEITGPQGAEIYYSLDGEYPREDNAFLYEGPVTLEYGVKLMAIAVVPGTQPGEAAQLDFALLQSDEALNWMLKEGYDRPDSMAVPLRNNGDVEAVITSVGLEGEDARLFTLNTSLGGKLPPYSTDSRWTVRPATGLEPGEYTAELVFTLDGGSSLVVPVSVTVS